MGKGISKLEKYHSILLIRIQGDNLLVDKKHTIVHKIYKAVYTRGDKGCCQ